MNNNILYQTLDGTGKDFDRLRNISLRTKAELDSFNAVYNVNYEFSAEKMYENQSNIRGHTVFDTSRIQSKKHNKI